MSERVLLAGCGDLGQRVASTLLAHGYTVFALRRQVPPDPAGAIHWRSGDLVRRKSLTALPCGVTQLVYLPAPDTRDKAVYHAVFVAGLRHLFKALDTTALRRVILVSSSAVYGRHDGAWVDEETPVAPPGFNGKILLEAEHQLNQLAMKASWSPLVLRLAGLYGPGRMHLIMRLRAGSVTVPRVVPHWANRIHVDDAAAAIVHLLHLPSAKPLYLGVDNTPLPLHVLYDYLAGLLGLAPPVPGPAPAGVSSKRLSNARLRASGFVPCWPDAREGYAALIRSHSVR